MGPRKVSKQHSMCLAIISLNMPEKESTHKGLQALTPLFSFRKILGLCIGKRRMVGLVKKNWHIPPHNCPIEGCLCNSPSSFLLKISSLDAVRLEGVSEGEP